MTEVTQHVTRFEKRHGTCNSDRVSKSFSKDVASERCYKGQEELDKTTENRAPPFVIPPGMNENLIEQFRSGAGILPVKMLRVQTDVKQPAPCEWYVCALPWRKDNSHGAPDLSHGNTNGRRAGSLRRRRPGDPTLASCTHCCLRSP